VPKAIDQGFVRKNLAFVWVFAATSAVFIPALAFANTTAALASIPIIMAGNVISMYRMQPQFVAAYRIAALHAEDDLKF